MNENQVYEDYQVKETTEALESIRHKMYRTKIRDQNGVYYTSKTVNELLSAACGEGGSTLEKIRKAVSYILRSNQELPLPINTRKYIYCLPTCSPDHPDCIWIFYSHIQRLTILDKQTTLIHFKNNDTIIVPVSKYTIDEQFNRTKLILMSFSGGEKYA
ncbi:competence protein ComK [Fredinandcohnia humi]